jgi:hypothetical protein
MSQNTAKQSENQDGEPRWPALFALFVIGALEHALPRQLAFGPGWLLLVLVAALAVPTVLARRSGHHTLNRVLAYILNSIVTLALIGSLGLLVRSLPRHTVPPEQMLKVAAVLWTSNVLVFASWYWRLDAGGPGARDLRDAHTEGAFLFPQMTLPQPLAASMRASHGGRAWSPRFVDYLFLAFTASTAFSPTDVPVLSRWAKVLMMVQTSISLMTIALLAARAINVI